MKSLDMRSEPAVKLLSEFLDLDAEYDENHPRSNAEHFAHGKLQCSIRIHAMSSDRMLFRAIQLSTLTIPRP